ncbi:ribosome biogenesis protein ytm1 [Dispira simplex]|nr:ribosome biogenesis protein ytm1 [Dispira simplex]
MTDNIPQIQVRFTTQLSKYAVPDAPILLPVSLKRYGLSEIINHLLQLSPPVPFQFLVQGKPLKGTIAAYLKSDPNISTEHVLELEYTQSLVPPRILSEYKVDDWLSSVRINPSGLVLTGCYDGTAKIYSSESRCMYSMEAHKASIKSLTWLASPNVNTLSFVTGAQDCTIMGWQLPLPDASPSTSEVAVKAMPLFEGLGHSGSVDTMDLSQNQSQLATAGSDGIARLWSVGSSDDVTVEAPEEEEEGSAPKRRKVRGKPVTRKQPTGSCAGHNGGINAVCFDQSANKILYSGGYDYALRVWDTEYCANVTTKPGDRVILEVAHSPLANLVATGNTDRLIRLWDVRSKDSSLVKLTLSSHNGWVSALRWSEKSSHILASGSYDGTVRLWDIRNPTSSLYTVYVPKQESGAFPTILSLDWHNGVLASGGEEGILRLVRTKY